MKNKKYFALALAPLLVALYFVAFTEAFSLLRAQSDFKVFLGVLVIALIIGLSVVLWFNVKRIME
ncbi:hypothetical protein [Olivibacter sitiensis]|uniref:hypothetical protein n=1 Tax=Olivibacter sitiensis TaxID=376470 RepID=UPI00041377BD|nr:hypothetical protein [Olivibacter sitiensis]